MTTEQETRYIHELLPLLAKQPYGYSIFDEYQDSHPGLKDNDVLLLGTRLQEEGLVTEGRDVYYYLITSKGATIARAPGGYLGYLESEAKQKREEERRAQGNLIGTFGSFIVAGLALAFTLYTYFSAAHDTQALEKQIKLLEQRLDKLTQQQH